MNILFTICGRAGSKGIKNKNIREFCGFPLSYYTFAVVDMACREKSDWIADMVINSDSRELLHTAEENPFYRADCIERCKELSGDSVPKISVIEDCVQKMQQRKGIKYDVVVDLDLTSPLRTVEDLKNLIKVHLSTGADVTTSVTNSRRNPYFNMVKKTEHGYKKVLKSNFTARQQAPEMFDMNASLYAYKPEYLKSGKGVLDGYCECIHMYDTGILDLDDENDFELMQVLAMYLFNNNERFREIRRYIEEKTS